MAYRCPVCGRSFKTKAGLTAHIRRAHPQHYKKAKKVAKKIEQVTRVVKNVKVEIVRSKSKKGRPVIVLKGNFDKDPATEEIAVYISRLRKRTKKGGTTAPARVFNLG